MAQNVRGVYHSQAVTDPPDSASVDREFQRIASALRFPTAIALLLEPQRATIRGEDGMIAYFQAGVQGPQPGFYGYENGAWSKL